MNNTDFKKIKLLILDVDGIMTDGTFFMSNSGDVFKRFNVLDGYGVKYALQKGLQIAIISGGTYECVIRRSKELGIKHLFMGEEDKLAVYNEKLKPLFNFKNEEVAFMADDVYDMPLMKAVGVSITVPNAHEEVKKMAKHITSRSGGTGAVREVIDLIFGT